MNSQWIWRAFKLSRRIWVRATLFSLLAVLVALLGIALSPYIPSDLPTKVGADAVDHVLSIIASSMLTVTTFSLSVMVAASTAATNNVTPRSTRLVMEDNTTQNVLSTFVGSFIFSLVSIIVLSTGAYGSRGRVVLFGATLLVIGLILFTLLRWIDHLAKIGRVTETIALVEKRASKAMREHHQSPHLGGSPLSDPAAIPALATPVHSENVGYVQHVDVRALSDLIGKIPGQIYVRAIPGDFVDPTHAIAQFTGLEAENAEPMIRDCFTISDTRSFDQDPRFGASVLAEIGSRALSSGVNDPGTAIDVIGRAVRLLTIWTEPAADYKPKYPKIHVPPVALDDLFDDIFTPLARDGAGIVEVGLRLQRAFLTLARIDPETFGPLARRHARGALQRSGRQLLELDQVRLTEVASDILGRP